MEHTADYAIPRRGGVILAGLASPPLQLRVNGRAAALCEGSAAMPLHQVLRDEFGLMRTNLGSCNGARGDCGACTVLVDGRAAASCQIAAGDATGKDIVTIEGLAAEPDNRVMAAFAAEEALGCRACWPGTVLAAAALLAGHWRPSDAEIDKAMSAVSCRCGDDPRMRRAIRRAAGFPPG